MRQYFMKPEEFNYYTTLKPRVNHNAKDMLSEIDKKLTNEEQRYFVKNNRLARLQNSFNFE